MYALPSTSCPTCTRDATGRWSLRCPSSWSKARWLNWARSTCGRWLTWIPLVYLYWTCILWVIKCDAIIAGSWILVPWLTGHHRQLPLEHRGSIPDSYAGEYCTTVLHCTAMLSLVDLPHRDNTQCYASILAACTYWQVTLSRTIVVALRSDRLKRCKRMLLRRSSSNWSVICSIVL